jgi:hypothetical protein
MKEHGSAKSSPLMQVMGGDVGGPNRIPRIRQSKRVVPIAPSVGLPLNFYTIHACTTSAGPRPQNTTIRLDTPRHLTSSPLVLIASRICAVEHFQNTTDVCLLNRADHGDHVLWRVFQCSVARIAPSFLVRDNEP